MRISVKITEIFADEVRKLQNLHTMAKLTICVRENETLAIGQRYKVFLRVTHNGRTCYAETGVSVGTSIVKGKVIVNLKYGVVLPQEPGSDILNADLLQLLRKAQNTLDNLRNPSSLSCKGVLAALQNDEVYCIDHKLSCVCDDYCRRLERDGRASYASMIRVTVADWLECYKDMRIERITAGMITEFKRFLSEKQKNGKNFSEATIYKKLSHLKVLINHGRSKGIKFETNPFYGVRIPRSDADYSVIDPDLFSKWKGADIPEGTARIVHDMWMLTFYLCGANFCDIYGADLSGPVFSFSRQKIRHTLQTRLTTHIPIIPEARRIIDKYIGKDGRLHFHFEQKDSKSIIRYLGHYLRKLREPMNLPSYFRFTTARDTFAQYCMELMYPDAITDYLLGHSANSRGVMSYYSKMPPKIAEKYILRVVDYALHPERYEDYIEQRMFGM